MNFLQLLRECSALCLENSQSLVRAIRVYSRWGLQPTAYISFPELHQEFATPTAKFQGIRLKRLVHKFGISMESMSGKWKPNSLSFLYRQVSST